MTDVHPMERLRQTFEYELAPYGSYLAMRGAKEHQQRFGLPELGLAVLAVAAWAAKEYLQAYFQELGKRHAEAPANDAEQDLELTAKLDELIEELKATNRRQEVLEAKWQALTAQLPADLPYQLPTGQADREALLALLTDLGLSTRVARKASLSILMHVEHQVD